MTALAAVLGLSLGPTGRAGNRFNLKGRINANPLFVGAMMFPGVMAGTVNATPVFHGEMLDPTDLTMHGSINADPVFAGELNAPPALNLEGVIDAHPVLVGEMTFPGVMAGTVDAHPVLTGLMQVGSLAGAIDATPVLHGGLLAPNMAGTINSNPVLVGDITAPPAAHTPPTYIADNVDNLGTGAQTITWPAGSASGDFILIIVETANQGALSSPPSGFAQIGTRDNAQSAGGVLATRMTVYGGFRGAGATAACTVTAAIDHCFVDSLAFRGVKNTGTLGDAYNFFTGNTGSGTNITFPSVTTEQDHSLLVYSTTNPFDGSKSATFGNTGDLAAPAGGVGGFGLTGGNGGNLTSYYGTKVTTATVNPTPTATQTSDQWVSNAVELIAA